MVSGGKVYVVILSRCHLRRECGNHSRPTERAPSCNVVKMAPVAQSMARWGSDS